jgi:hypothetical protein
MKEAYINYLKFVWNLVVKPSSTLKKLLTLKDRNKFCAIFLIILEILYTVTMIGYTVAGIKIFYPTFTKIPPESQHFWDIFLTAPVTFFCMLLVIGFIHLLSKIFKSKGKYEDLFIVVTIAVTLPFYVTWFFDTVMLVLIIISNTYVNSFLHKIISSDLNKIIINIIYMLPCLIWNFILLKKSIMLAENIKNIPAAFISLLNVVLFWGIMFLILF